MAGLQVMRLRTSDADFEAALSQRLAWESVSDAAVAEQVDAILQAVRARGDVALCEYTARFDKRPCTSAAALEIPQADLHAAWDRLPAGQQAALRKAAERIRTFHEAQKPAGFMLTDADGNRLGQRVVPLDRVGVYVPGGKAAYPSSVLMNVIPAKVAGVQQVVMVVPTPGGERNTMVFAAAALAGADRVFAIGGAQAVAALAYGTETVPRVDKIVGPGNVYVATAKRAVFGQVGIDMIAGPSEILVFCDGRTPPEWIAADLFSQAEHDEQAQSILLCDDAKYLDAVEAACQRLLKEMPRADIISASFASRSCFIEVQSTAEAIAIINRIAPEHLELSVEDPQPMLSEIRHAGAIFLGRYTPEAFGDYCAGPNHVLPTSGTARYSSPLGVYDFVKRSSIIDCSPHGAQLIAPVAAELADAEGLAAHALSARLRLYQE